MKKKVAAAVLLAVMGLSMLGCGKTYTCSSCGKGTKTVYYNLVYPNDPDKYMCAECAEEYYAPMDYKNYKVQ